MHNFKNGTEQTYGDNNFRPYGRKNCADKKMFVFSPGRPAEFNRIFGFRQEEVRKSIRYVKLFFVTV